MLSAHQAELAFVLFIHYSEHSATRAAYAFMLYSCPHQWLNHPSLYLGGSVNEAQGTDRHSVARWIFVLFENTVQWRLLGPRGLYFHQQPRCTEAELHSHQREGRKRKIALCLKDYLQFAPQIIGEKKSALTCKIEFWNDLYPSTLRNFWILLRDTFYIWSLAGLINFGLEPDEGGNCSQSKCKGAF